MLYSSASTYVDNSLKSLESIYKIEGLGTFERNRKAYDRNKRLRSIRSNIFQLPINICRLLRPNTVPESPNNIVQVYYISPRHSDFQSYRACVSHCP